VAAQGRGKREREILTGEIEDETIENEKRGEDLDWLYICMWAKFKIEHF